MKNINLFLFAVLITLGWTALAAGTIAVLSGLPLVTSPRKAPVAPAQVKPAAPALLSGPPCTLGEHHEASVPCSA